MNSARHLLNEDRPDFERVLDEALHSAGPGLEAMPAGSPLNSEQLRTMALSAAEPIAACAAPEYLEYLRVREDLREAAEEAERARADPPDGEHSTGYAALGVADTSGTGPGLVPIVVVLTPILSGTAAVIFLLIGYVLRAVTPEPAIAQPLRTAGWLFLGVAAVGILLGMVGLLLTARRDSASALHETPEQLPPELAAARDAWRDALRDRGVLPFLHEAMAKASLTPNGAVEPPPSSSPPSPRSYDSGARGSRMPRLGYSRPDFTSPDADGPAERGPSFSSPDFFSPDFTSPDFGPDAGDAENDRT